MTPSLQASQRPKKRLELKRGDGVPLRWKRRSLASNPLSPHMRLPSVIPLTIALAWGGSLTATPQQGGETEVLLHFDGGGPSERLGEALAFGGDINADGTPDILVGAEFADSFGFTRNGLAVVYSGTNGAILHQFFGSADFENLGTVVISPGDMNGDGFDDILIGSGGADPGILVDAGRIEIFSGADGSSLLRIDGTSDFGRFGAALAGLGDLDTDGTPDFMVGEPGRNNDAGRVHVYSGLSGTTLFQKDGTAGDACGTAVSAAGDLNGDGTPDWLAGSPFADTSSFTDNGTAEVFSGATGASLLLMEGTASNDQFGHALDGGLQVDLDGVPDFIIGIPNRNPGSAPAAGSAAVYDGATANLVYLIEGSALADNLGNAVALTGDVDGDGFGDFLVGARLMDAGGQFDAGSAFLYSGRDGSLLERIDGIDPQDNCGDSVAGGADIDGDGFADYAVAAPFADNVALLAGTVDVQRTVPVLDISTSELSAAAGGSVDFQVNFPLSEAGNSYRLLASHTGVGPFVYQGISIPLTYDNTFQLMLGSGPPQFTDNVGVLDASGDADALLTLAAGEASSLVGLTIRFSVATLTGPTLRGASNLRTLVFVP